MFYSVGCGELKSAAPHSTVRKARLLKASEQPATTSRGKTQ